MRSLYQILRGYFSRKDPVLLLEVTTVQEAINAAYMAGRLNTVFAKGIDRERAKLSKTDSIYDWIYRQRLNK